MQYMKSIYFDNRINKKQWLSPHQPSILTFKPSIHHQKAMLSIFFGRFKKYFVLTIISAIKQKKRSWKSNSFCFTTLCCFGKQEYDNRIRLGSHYTFFDSKSKSFYKLESDDYHKNNKRSLIFR